MHILCIDTSTSTASLALTTDDRLLAAATFNADRTLSVRLMPEIEHLLEMSSLTIRDLDLLACATGPGSFTGVRAGVATIQGLSLACNKPCVGFSSLSLMALNFPMAAWPVATMLDARKGEVYAALFDCSAAMPVPLIRECVMAPEAFLDQITNATSGPVILAGDGTDRYRDVIAARLGKSAILAPFTHNICHAANGAILALAAHQAGNTLAPAQLLPVYLRASEAEYAKLEKQAKLRAKQLT